MLRKGLADFRRSYIIKLLHAKCMTTFTGPYLAVRSVLSGLKVRVLRKGGAELQRHHYTLNSSTRACRTCYTGPYLAVWSVLLLCWRGGKVVAN